MKTVQLCLEKGFEAAFRLSLQHGIYTLKMKKKHLHDHATKPPPWLLQKDPELGSKRVQEWGLFSQMKGTRSRVTKITLGLRVQSSLAT